MADTAEQTENQEQEKSTEQKSTEQKDGDNQKAIDEALAAAKAEWEKEVEEKIKKACGCNDAEVYFLVGGTVMKVKSRKAIAMLSAGILTLSCIPAEMFPVSATSAVTENTLQLGAPVTIDNNLVCEVLEQKEDETFLLKITDVKDTTITSLTFPEEYDGYPIQFVELGDSVFEGCKNLTEITLPDEISAIPPQAFYGCTSLTTVNASNVTEIESEAFCNCTSLTTLNVS